MFSIGNGGIGKALNDDDDADGAAGRPVPAIAGTACSAAIDATNDDPAGPPTSATALVAGAAGDEIDDDPAGPPGAARAAPAIAAGNDGKGNGMGKGCTEPLSHARR